MPNTGHTQIYASGPIATLRGLHAAAHATRRPAEADGFVRHAFGVHALTGNARVERYVAYTELDQVDARPGRAPTLAMAVGVEHDIDAFDFAASLSERYPDLTFDAGFRGECDFPNFDAMQAKAGVVTHHETYRDGFEFRTDESTRSGRYHIASFHPRSQRGGSDDRWLMDALGTVATMAQAAPGWHGCEYEGPMLLWQPGAPYGTGVRLGHAGATVYGDVDGLAGYGSMTEMGFDACIGLHPELGDVIAAFRSGLETGPTHAASPAHVMGTHPDDDNIPF